MKDGERHVVCFIVLAMLYRTPRRCAGLCCQIFPFNGLTTGRFTLIAFLFQLIPPPQ